MKPCHHLPKIITIIAIFVLCSFAQALFAQNWQFISNMGNGSNDNQEYGTAISVSGDYAIIGSKHHNVVPLFYKNWKSEEEWSSYKILTPTLSTYSFGRALQISGEQVIIGGPYQSNDSTGGNYLQYAGAAYIFSKDQGGTDNWGEVRQLDPGDRASGDNFGTSVAISGNNAVIGSPYQDYNSSGTAYLEDAGAVYIFSKDQGCTDCWGELKKIVPSDRQTYDYFGMAVGISGNIMAASGDGCVYIFYKDQDGPNNWGFVKKITSPEADDYLFGVSLVMEGNYIVVGSTSSKYDASGTNSLTGAGAAYVFSKDNGGTDQWGLEKKLVHSDRASGDNFGYQVSISGHNIVVTAPNEDEDQYGENTISNAGSAYIFNKDEGGINNWGELTKIVSGYTRAANDYFGSAVSISGNFLMTSIPTKFSVKRGQAYFFRDFMQASNVTPTDIQENQMTFNWTNGNCSHRYVFMKQTTSGSAVPQRWHSYISNSVFGSGDEVLDEAYIGTGWYCVYSGSGNQATVTGLIPGTDYRIHVCENIYESYNTIYDTTITNGNPYQTASAISLSGVGYHIANEKLTNTTTNMQYSLTSTDGTDGTWFDCTELTTDVTFDDGQVYIRQKNLSSNFRLIVTIPTAPAAPSYTIDYVNEETNESVPTTVEFNYDNNFLTSNENGTSETVTMLPGNDIYFRVQPTETTLASDVFQLFVPARPATPDYSIDYVSEMTNEAIPNSVEYNTDNNFITPNSIGFGITIAVTPGTDLYFRVKATVSSFKSDVLALDVPDRPAATTYTIDYAGETTAENVATTDEYDISASFTSPTTGASSTITLTPGTDLYFRTASTASSFSGEIQHLVVPSRPATTAYSIDYPGESTAQPLPETDEYSVNPDMSDASGGAGSTLTITPGTDLYFRTKSTASSFASSIQHLVVPPRPNIPVVSLSDKNAINAKFMKSADGTGSQVTTGDGYEYSTDGGTTWDPIYSVITEVDASGLNNIIVRRASTAASFKSLPTDNLDSEGIPVVSAEVQSACNNDTEFITAQSNTDNGKLYIILDGEPQSTQTELDDAVAANKGSSIEVTTANTPYNIPVTGLVPGTYYAYAVNAVGELSMKGSNAIQVFETPVIDLGEDIYECLGTEVVLDAGGGFSQYSWMPGEITSQQITVTSAGEYTATVTDINGCTATDQVTVNYVQPVEDNDICMVTIDLSTGNNIIIWEKSEDPAVVGYNVYRETSVMGEYEAIGYVDAASLSIFMDTVADPESQQYLYKLAAVDTCGNISIKGSFHKSLKLRYVGSIGGVELQWSEYEIEDGEMNFKTYELYRGSESTSLTKIVDISSSLDNYTDNDPSVFDTEFFYRIAGVKINPCYPTGTINKKSDAGPYSHSMSNLEDNRMMIQSADDDNISRKISIIPNPFTLTTTIHFTNPTNSEYMLSVCDLSGKVVYLEDNITGNEVILERGNLSAGYYLVELIGENIYRGRIVIE